MYSKCSMCWDLSRKFSQMGDDGRAAEAAEMARRFRKLEGEPREVEHDHEGTMARGELGSLLRNAEELRARIGADDELPGWVSGYITLASDYMNSVAQYMRQIDEDKKD